MTTAHRAGTASAAVLSGLVLALGLAHAAAPQWARRAGLDLWSLSDSQNTIQKNQQEMAQLEAQEERLHQESETLDHLATRLAVGTVSLAEATDTAEPILRNRSSAATLMRYYQTPTLHLMVARHMIARVERCLDTDLSRWATASMRLEAEYAAMK